MGNPKDWEKAWDTHTDYMKKIREEQIKLLREFIENIKKCIRVDQNHNTYDEREPIIKQYEQKLKALEAEEK